MIHNIFILIHVVALEDHHVVYGFEVSIIDVDGTLDVTVLEQLLKLLDILLGELVDFFHPGLQVLAEVFSANLALLVNFVECLRNLLGILLDTILEVIVVLVARGHGYRDSQSCQHCD